MVPEFESLLYFVLVHVSLLGPTLCPFVSKSEWNKISHSLSFTLSLVHVVYRLRVSPNNVLLVLPDGLPCTPAPFLPVDISCVVHCHDSLFDKNWNSFRLLWHKNRSPYWFILRVQYRPTVKLYDGTFGVPLDDKINQCISSIVISLTYYDLWTNGKSIDISWLFWKGGQDIS